MDILVSFISGSIIGNLTATASTTVFQVTSMIANKMFHPKLRCVLTQDNFIKRPICYVVWIMYMCIMYLLYRCLSSKTSCLCQLVSVQRGLQSSPVVRVPHLFLVSHDCHMTITHMTLTWLYTWSKETSCSCQLVSVRELGSQSSPVVCVPHLSWSLSNSF